MTNATTTATTTATAATTTTTTTTGGCTPPPRETIRHSEIARWTLHSFDGLNSTALAHFSAQAIYSIVGLPSGAAATAGTTGATATKQHGSLVYFLAKVYRITRVRPIVILTALKYLERFRQRCLEQQVRATATPATPMMTVTPEALASSGLFITALILANHYLDDHAYTNKTWSQVTNVHVHVINATQRQFLHLVHYSLHIGQQECDQWMYYMYSILRTMEAPAPPQQHHHPVQTVAATTITTQQHQHQHCHKTVIDPNQGTISPMASPPTSPDDNSNNNKNNSSNNLNNSNNDSSKDVVATAAPFLLSNHRHGSKHTFASSKHARTAPGTGVASDVSRYSQYFYQQEQQQQQ